MRLESKKVLEDVRLAAAHILEFTRGKTFDDYVKDEMLQSAVVWDVIQQDLPQLHNEVKALIMN